MDVVGLCGSLRKRSFNRSALQLAGSCMPADMRLEILEWDDVPAFNSDDMVQGWGPRVAALRERIRRADGVVMATPEYNFSIPGAFKNLIDWLSRGDDQPLAFKPVAILSAATGPLGGARVQYDLRKVLLFMQAQVLAKPEVFIGQAASKFDGAGNCTDGPTRQFVTDQMAAFERWIEAVRRMHLTHAIT